eukprot:scaffold752_cov322-Pavlova_lutheri.AAC.40
MHLPTERTYLPQSYVEHSHHMNPVLASSKNEVLPSMFVCVFAHWLVDNTCAATCLETFNGQRPIVSYVPGPSKRRRLVYEFQWIHLERGLVFHQGITLRSLARFNILLAKYRSLAPNVECLFNR